MVKATFRALSSVQTPRMVAAKRGKKISEIYTDRHSIDSAQGGEANV
jgi:hypothetical protein